MKEDKLKRQVREMELNHELQKRVEHAYKTLSYYGTINHAVAK